MIDAIQLILAVVLYLGVCYLQWTMQSMRQNGNCLPLATKRGLN